MKSDGGVRLPFFPVKKFSSIEGSIVSAEGVLTDMGVEGNGNNWTRERKKINWECHG